MTVLEMTRTVVPINTEGALMTWWGRRGRMHRCDHQTVDNDVLWQEFLAGAERSYRRHGIATALDVDAIRRGGDTRLYWSMLNATGTVSVASVPSVR